MSAKKGIDYPSKVCAIAVGVAETGTGTPNGTGDQKKRVKSGVSGTPAQYYGLFFERKFQSYSNGQYTYYDIFYERLISVGSAPTPVQTDVGIRYKPMAGSAVNYLQRSAVSSLYSVGRSVDIQTATSPKSYGWSPTKGAKRYDDPLIAIPENSKETPDGGSNGGGNNSGGGNDDGGDPPDEDVKIPGFGKARKTFWNAPLISYASGAYIPVDTTAGGIPGLDLTTPTGRGDILGPGGYGTRLSRKGFLRQYIYNNPNDWRAGDYTKTDDEESTGEDTGASASEAMVEPGKKYGFRFHYNPATLRFSVGYNAEVNPALIISSKTRAMPITTPEGGGPSVSLELYLNRIEDISLIRKRGADYVIENTLKNAYTKGVTKKDLEQIATKGTMYDIEQLLLVCLGRKFQNKWRGETADIGFIFGVPLELHLSKNMRYKGRISSMQYTHTSFTPDMIPMFTTLDITFDRYPDADSFSNKPAKDPKDEPAHGGPNPPKPGRPNQRGPRR